MRLLSFQSLSISSSSTSFFFFTLNPRLRDFPPTGQGGGWKLCASEKCYCCSLELAVEKRSTEFVEGRTSPFGRSRTNNTAKFLISLLSKVETYKNTQRMFSFLKKRDKSNKSTNLPFLLVRNIKITLQRQTKGRTPRKYNI